jgi:putative cardiolipin synthase
MGVALHEFRPFRLDASGAGPPGSSRASLHSKALVVDRRQVWIGSFNLDPRSIRLNTENGVLIDNPRLADELAARVLDDTSPAKSWKLEFAAGCADTRRCPLRWRGTVDGVERVLDREPEASLARRAMVRFMRLLPPADTFL